MLHETENNACSLELLVFSGLFSFHIRNGTLNKSKEMFTATFLYEQFTATVNENHHHLHPWIRSFGLFRHPVNENDWLNKHSETGLFLENSVLFKVFVGRSVTTRSRSITGTNCHSRSKMPVKICCPVSFFTYLEIATDTVHFAQKPSATGASAVASLQY
jgi:hypothetical protein